MTRREKRLLARTGGECRGQNIAIGALGAIVVFFLATTLIPGTSGGAAPPPRYWS